GVQAFADLGGSVYVGKQGSGLFRSADHGAHWTSVAAGLSSPDVVDLAVHHAALFALVQTTFSNDVFRSADGGQHWTKLPAPNASQPLFPDGQALYAGGAFRVFRSGDDGQPWTPSQTPLVEVTALRQSGAVLIALSQSLVFRSSDEGDPFSPADTGLPPG